MRVDSDSVLRLGFCPTEKPHAVVADVASTFRIDRKARWLRRSRREGVCAVLRLFRVPHVTLGPSGRRLGALTLLWLTGCVHPVHESTTAGDAQLHPDAQQHAVLVDAGPSCVATASLDDDCDGADDDCDGLVDEDLSLDGCLEPACVEAAPRCLTCEEAYALGADGQCQLLEDTWSVTLSATNLERFEALTLSFQLPSAYNNPFDPDEVRVDATFTQVASGRSMTVPCYWYQAFERVGELSQAVGDAYWRCHFTPSEMGSWNFLVEVTDSDGTQRLERSSAFQVDASSRRGFVRRHGAHLVDDEGALIFPIGLNMGWAARQSLASDYDRWLTALAEQGGNFVRIWLAPWALALEWKDTGLGTYAERLDLAWELDQILAQCQALGIDVMLTLQPHGPFSSDVDAAWAENPYNSAQGGPLSTPSQLWSHPEATTLQRRLWRYLIARYAHVTALAAWELWNEVDWVDDFDAHVGAAVLWHEQARAWFKDNDPYQHIVTTSVAHITPDSSLWDTGMDMVQTHQYGAQDMAQSVSDLSRTYRALHDKPYLVTELGTGHTGADNGEVDPEGRHLHNGLWAAALSGAAGGACVWWWDSYVEPWDLWHHYRGISRFLEGEGDHILAAEPREPRVETARRTDFELRPGLPWAVEGLGPMVLDRQGALWPAATLWPRYLYGNWKADLGQALTVNATLSAATTLEVAVKAVGAGTNRLALSVNGLEHETMPLSEPLSGDNEAILSWPLEAGPQQWRFDNSGDDWLELASLRVIDHVAMARALILSVPERVLGWVHHRAHVWSSPASPRRVDDAVLFLEGLEDGPWYVSWWDTRSGEVVYEQRIDSMGASAPIAVPPLTTDWAFKLAPSSPSCVAVSTLREAAGCAHRALSVHPDKAVGADPTEINIALTESTDWVDLRAWLTWAELAPESSTELSLERFRARALDAELRGQSVHGGPLLGADALPEWLDALSPELRVAHFETRVRTLVSQLGSQVQSWELNLGASNAGAASACQQVLGEDWPLIVLGWAHEENAAAASTIL